MVTEIATLDVQLNLLGGKFQKDLNKTISSVTKNMPKNLGMADAFNKELQTFNTQGLKDLFKTDPDKADELKSKATRYNQIAEAFVYLQF